MRKTAIEAWALEIIARVVAGQPVEDSRVELKSEWIDAKKAARRLAGHANSAGGEQVLWLIGVDYDGRRIIGASALELANWYPAVEKFFDEVAPTLTDVNIPYNGVTVTALLFETDRAPYVYKTGEAPYSCEVPIRHGTRVGSASRRQLLATLRPVTERREAELIWCKLIVNPSGGRNGELYVSLRGGILLLQPQGQQTYLASHRAEAIITLVNGTSFALPLAFRSDGASRKFRAASTLALIGPQAFGIEAGKTFKTPITAPIDGSAPPKLRISFDVPNSHEPVVVQMQLRVDPFLPRDTGSAFQWIFRHGPDDDEKPQGESVIHVFPGD